jgi:hypothetical protein
MLQEVRWTRQIPGERRRRWFRSDDMDLIVWLNAAGAPDGFQLCYNRSTSEHAITWEEATGFTHMAVDDGESPDLPYKATPILVADGAFPKETVRARFTAQAEKLPADLSDYVATRLARYPV